MKNKILQFGSGVFLRGFWGWMVNELNKNENFDASITMVKLTPRGDLSQFKETSGLYSLSTKGLLNGEVIDTNEEIDIYQRFIHPYPEWVEFLLTAEEEDLQIVVSNSTEAGIVYKQCLFPNECPETYPAKLCAWLYKRFVHFDQSSDKAPLILPMELIESNGDKLQEIIIKHANDWGLDHNFITWVQKDCDFRNTLVDRIVTKGDKNDACVEPYHLFAIEGEEAEEILPLKKAGVNVFWTKNLPAFRETKVRMLNGGHTSMIYAAILSGETIVADALEKLEIDQFLRSILLDEVLPTLEAKGGDKQELTDYAEAVIERFKNPFLNHEMINIALNSASKLLVRILPSFNDSTKLNKKYPEKLSKAIAAFFWFYRGSVEGDTFKGESEGLTYEFADDAKAMSAIAKCDTSSAANFAKAILACSAWKGAFNKHPDFEATLTKILEEFEEKGLKASLFPNT
ncbi:tagaturonate reductase [Lentisphaera araneosa HTCC2155]|uniref:Tagaturonate reductase n=1 Tax=Lentisphaera araneosa HTCC2155 TaxID=313628 RepID=A6DPG6_9BACT|nr:tagaturonate reductase [Lentisphaera araneosa]EDM26462.1 tagaturonate reductase [Lentisphaera araneosa HTCC2155]